MNKNIIIFGLGKLFDTYRDQIDFSKVQCLVDTNPAKQGHVLYEKNIVSPDQMKSMSFDFVVVFSTRFFLQIYYRLLYVYEVPMEKIIDFKTYFKGEQAVSLDLYSHGQAMAILQIFNKANFRSILDIDAFFTHTHLYSRDNDLLFKQQDIYIAACQKSKCFPIAVNLYNVIYDSLSDLDAHTKFDVAVFTDCTKLSRAIDYEKSIAISQKYAKAMLVFLPVPYGEANQKKFLFPFEKYGKLRRIFCTDFYAFLLEFPTEAEDHKMQMYIVTHKAFFPPREVGYIPIQAGKYGKASLGYLEDSSGDNISFLNPYLNECTVLYWLWKNVSCEFIGMEHYRRFFLRNGLISRENLIDQETVNEIFCSYDIILVNEFSFYPETVGKSVMLDTDEALYHKAYDLVKNLILQRQPQYIKAFEYVMSEYGFYKANMFITRKRIMDEYCTWLFSFILDAAKQLNVDGYSMHQKRMIGFFAERMLTVWLMNQKLRIKEMPIIEIL